MATEEELQAQIDQLIQDKEELEQQLNDAGFDQEEFDKIKGEKKTAEEQLTAVQKKLDEQQKTNALHVYERNRDKAIKESGLPEDHPVIEVMFPKDEPITGDAFTQKAEKLKEIAATMSPNPQPPKEENDPEAAKWKGFKGGVQTETEMTGKEGQTEKQRRWQGAKDQFKNDRDPVNLAKHVIGRLKRVVPRRTRGGTSFYEIEEVNR